MMKLELSPRLAAVAAWVPRGAVVADIGTDHAYLPAWLLLNGQVSRAIGADLRTDPIRRARQTVTDFRLADRLDIRQCDGLEAISPEECDTITIAGMGGETMAGILARAPWTRYGKRLILEPQSTQEVLRRFLWKNGYTILAERAVREGERWYPILLVEGGTMPPLTPGETVAGRQRDWIREPEREVYLAWLLHRANTPLEGMRRASDANRTRREEQEQVVNYLEECLGENLPGKSEPIRRK